MHPQTTIPRGLCQCGCGGQTAIAKKSDPRYSTVKGQPLSYLPNHEKWKSPVEYVERDCGFETLCWIWQRTINGRGYGESSVSGRQRLAHIVIYERHRGPIPAGHDLHHLCGNRPCVNPDHLEPKTRRQHALAHYSTLTEADVAEIARLKGVVPQRELARRFRCGKQTVARIHCGQW